MKPWFEVGDDNAGWSAQKVTNLHLMLQLVRVLVSPTNPPGAASSCQKAMFHCGLLQQLCTILMATGVPADILTETINTVSEVIRGCQMNQDYFASVNAPSNPPRPAIVVLLMSMVNERQPFVLRCAVLYCFQCFLYKNQKGQGEIVSTLLPSTIDATGNSVSAGQLLCGGLFSTDSLSNWCAAVALAHALQENASLKEQLLRVQLATSLGNPPVSLLQQCTNILSQGDKIDRRGSKVQTRVGLLILLCTWLSNCPIAVTHFLHNSANVPFLTGQIAENLSVEEHVVQGLCALLLGISIYYNDNSLENYRKEKLKQLIEKRIGKENFIEKLGFISKHELYSRAAQKPQPNFSNPDYMMFDHEFTKLVKELEGVLTKAIYKTTEEDKKDEEVKKTLEQHDNIVTHYKSVIRVQDQELEELKKQVESLKVQNEHLQATVTQQMSQIQQHKDQYNLLKVQLGKDNQHHSSGNDVVQINGIQSEEMSKLREEAEEWKHKLERLEEQLREKDSLIEALKFSPPAVVGTSEGSSQTKTGPEVESELHRPRKPDKPPKSSKPSSTPSDRSKSKPAKGPKRPSESKSTSPTPKRSKHLGSTPARTPRPHSESSAPPSDDRSQPLTTLEDHPAQVVTVPSRSPSIYSRPPSEILDRTDSPADTRRDRRDWLTDVESGRRRYSRSRSGSYRDDYLPLSHSHRYRRYSPDSRSPSPYTYARRYFASRDRPDSRLSPYPRSREPDHRDRRSPRREELPPRPLQPPSAALGAPPSDPAPRHVDPPLYMPDLSKSTESSADSDDHGSGASDSDPDASDDMKAKIEDLPFDGEGLFHTTTDQYLTSVDDSRMTAKRLGNEIVGLAEERTSLKQQLDSANSTVAILQTEKSALQQEVAESKKEQDDLLVLLADQDQKIVALKNKLKELGEPRGRCGADPFLPAEDAMGADVAVAHCLPPPLPTTPAATGPLRLRHRRSQGGAPRVLMCLATGSQPPQDHWRMPSMPCATCHNDKDSQVEDEEDTESGDQGEEDEEDGKEERED
ncbi:UNVERIFIED_CONTAM: hypothetical protein K2H54_057062 [Gekko kuhli]